MDQNYRSGLRELQIAKGLVMLRWASIPILFGFGLLSTRLLGMSFQITPIYLLSCFFAVLNVGFTIHISLLARQLALRKGQVAMRRFLLRIVSQLMADLRAQGLRGVLAIPRMGLKILATIYLMVLEALKGVRFNLLSLENIMHTQVIVDLAVIILFVRFTGSSESPLTMLMVIPVITAGAVMGFYRGGMYALTASSAYLFLCLLIHFKAILHIKFYGPQFGDLSQSWGWAIGSFIAMVVALLGTAYLSHNLTAIFKERIFFLNQLLDQNRRDSLAQVNVAENVSSAWFILDPTGVVIRFRRGKAGLFPVNLAGKNLLEEIPVFKQYGLGYVIQSVLTGSRSREIERIKIQSQEGTVHTVSSRLMPITDHENKQLVLLIVEDITEYVFYRDRVEDLKHQLDATKTDLEKVSLESKEANQQLMKSLKLANDRSVEIENLTRGLKEIEGVKGGLDGKVDHLVGEVAALKAKNDGLSAEISYKQLILEELTELLKNCSRLDVLSAIIERRTKALFKLDNTCLHIFQSPEAPSRMNEILDTRKASPRLLDLPRKNPKVLDPVLIEGRPVFIKAEILPDKASAAMALTNAPVQRLVAYIPIRDGGHVIGMMMLDRYGVEENPERMLELLTFYLSHTAIALKNAIATQDLEVQRNALESTIHSLEAQIDGLLGLMNQPADSQENQFRNFLRAFCRITGTTDGLMVRVHNDGAFQILGRCDMSKPLELRTVEEKVLKTLQANPAHRATVKELAEGMLLLGYPIKLGQRLCGVLFLQHPETVQPPSAIVEVGVKLASQQLCLYVLGEEKELWENFYKENLTA